MTAITRERYNNLKSNVLLNTVNYNAQENYIAALKLRYENEINSKRSNSNINTLEQLLAVLEKRDCVSENNITVLEEIAKYIGNNKFLAELNNTQPNREERHNQELIHQSSTPVRKYAPMSDVSIHFDDQYNVKKRVRNEIARRMGKKWIDFARSLDVMESKIDDIKIMYSNDSELCVREILDYHDENALPREWKTQLLKALEEARRNDLKNRVNEIFDTFS